MTRCSCAIGALTVFLGVPTSIATEPTIPNPVFWCWEAPEGEAANNEHFLQAALIRGHFGIGYSGFGGEPTPDGWTPTLAGKDAALEALDVAVQDFQLSGSDPYAIIFDKFGHGMGQPDSSHFDTEYDDVTGLFRHWCDALPDEEIVDSVSTFEPPFGDYWGPQIEACWNVDYDAEPLDHGDLEDTTAEWWWNTPWTSTGRSDAYDFTSAFVYWYKELQDGEPNPYRIFFDSENRLRAIDSNGQPGTHDDVNAAMYAFDVARFDYTSRWGTSQVDGEEVLDGDDMFELFRTADAEVKAYQVGDDWDDPDNYAWTAWYWHLMNMVEDETIQEGLTGPIVAESANWPGIRASNYSCEHVDEGVEWILANKHGVLSWLEDLHPTCTCETQSPVFYRCSEDHMEGEEEIWDTCMRIHRVNLDAYVDSLDGGQDPTDIIPWIANMGTTLIGDQPDPHTGWDDVTFDRDEVRRLLALFRSRGIEEFILWNDVAQTNWTDMSQVQEEVWRFDATDIDLLVGSDAGSLGTSGMLTNMELRDGDLVGIDAEEYVSDPDVVEFVLTFTRNDDAAYHDLMFSLEADVDSTSSTDVVVEAYAWNYYTSQYDQLTMPYPGADDDAVEPDDRKLYVWKTEPTGSDEYVEDDEPGEAKIKLVFWSGQDGIRLRVDSVQLVNSVN